MQTPGESSRKYGPDVNPRKHFEKTRSGCKPRESLRKSTVRMQTPGKSPPKTRSRCKPQESLREITVRMQTSAESSREHGPDANPRKDCEKTRSGCKPMAFPRTASRCFFERILASCPCFYAYFGPWKLHPRTSSLEFYACFLGDFFGGSIFGVPREPPLQVDVLGILLIPSVFLRVFCPSASEGSCGEGGGEVNLSPLCLYKV